jgi:hypothetical protein
VSLASTSNSTCTVVSQHIVYPTNVTYSTSVTAAEAAEVPTALILSRLACGRQSFAELGGSETRDLDGYDLWLDLGMKKCGRALELLKPGDARKIIATQRAFESTRVTDDDAECSA